MRFAFIAVLGILLAPYLAHAFSLSTLYGPGRCTQINESYLVCPDSVPIKVTFSISAPYSYPYLGNFTVYSVQYWNTSEAVNIYSTGPCIVPWSGTTTCIIYLNPFSPTTWNGIIKRSIPLRLISNLYPQVSYNRSVNVTISHYITSGEAYILSFYIATSSRLSSMNSTYAYFCKLYSICSSSISQNLSLASNELYLANCQINNSKLYAAFANITLANETISKIEPSFLAFTNSSNKIVNNIIEAKYILANITNSYYANKENLSSCSFYNGTKYSSYINNSINRLNSYPVLNTMNGSEMYLNLVSGLRANETKLISICRKTPNLPIKFSSSTGFRYMLYIFGLILVVLIAYSVLRLNEGRQVKKMRHEYSAPKSTADENIGIKEVGEVSEGTTESYFDNWFSSNIAGEKGKDKASKKGGTAPKH